MKMIANAINGEFLQEILANAPEEDLEMVKAAVAYASSEKLLDFCEERKVPLYFYGRLDSSVPVSLPILKRFLSASAIYRNCKLVLEFYHPKVIWMMGYGAYFGSANLTERAWVRNVECGIWFDQGELEINNLLFELDRLFREIDHASEPLTQELYNQLKELDARNNGFGEAKKRLQADFDSNIQPRFSKGFRGLSQVSKRERTNRQLDEFLTEWNSTLQDLRKIAELVSSDRYRPSWVEASVPKGVQVDQFLHAYYYTQVKIGRQKSMYEELHLQNVGNPQAALEQQLNWWKDLPTPKDEYDMMYNKAPLLRQRFSSEYLPKISEDEFAEACLRVHAFRTSARQTHNSDLGLPAGTELNIDERTDMVARWMWKLQSDGGHSPIDVLRYVLYGGNLDDVATRIWEGAYSAQWHILRLGLSSLGEIVGWAMPDRYPPRNGRTSKAMRALGFNVQVYGD